MKCTLSIVVILASVAYAHVLPLVSYVQPVPQYNTAIVQSEQVGGSFAYSVSEGQAFQEISPIISTVSRIKIGFLCIYIQNTNTCINQVIMIFSSSKFF